MAYFRTRRCRAAQLVPIEDYGEMVPLDDGPFGNERHSFEQREGAIRAPGLRSHVIKYNCAPRPVGFIAVRSMDHVRMMEGCLSRLADGRYRLEQRLLAGRQGGAQGLHISAERNFGKHLPPMTPRNVV